MRRSDLQNLSQSKLEAGNILAHEKKWSNAYYLAGYAIELALKACVARQVSADTLPEKRLINDVYTHDISKLAGLAGLKLELKTKSDADSVFAANWAICSEWSPETRYQDKTAAETTFLLNAISNNENGVLPWIKKHW
jgi:HEPN domain-containing protein